MSKYQTTSRKSKSAQQKKVVTFGCIAIGLLLILVIALLLLPTPEKKPQSTVPPATTPQPTVTEPQPAPKVEPKIAKGVTIDGISVGKMTREQAIQAVNDSLDDIYQKENMVISLGDDTLTLTPVQSGAHLDVEAAVDAALNGQGTEITPKLSLDMERIEAALRSFYNRLGDIYTPSGYWLEGEAPDVITQEGTCQTLVINQGSAGHLVDFQDAMDKVTAAYAAQEFTVTLDALGEEKKPTHLELKKVLEQVSVPAVDPRVDPETLEVVYGRDGYGFDLQRDFNPRSPCGERRSK